MKKVINLLVAIVILVSYLALPMNTSAKTIAQFEAEVKKFTAELNAKKANLAKNDSEVAAIKARISSIEKQMKEAEAEIVKLQEEIDASNEEIARKSEESKKIIEYYQISNGENIYLEYAFGATDITDMIYRMSIVEQLTDYNDKIMKELAELIEKNKAQQVELTKKKEELKKLEAELESEKARIEADSQSIRESMPSIENQIKEAQAQVKYFKNLGCGQNEDIQACQYRVSQGQGGSLPSVGFFSRPMMKGYVTQGSHAGHIAVDLSSSNKTEPLYAVAEGTIHAIYRDDCTSGRWCSAAGISCNGNALVLVTKHNYGGRYYYVTYAHMSSYANVRVGQHITENTLLAYMGTSGCSTGPHLHMEISTCHWKNNGGCTYSQYQRRFVNPNNLISFPSRWNNR